MFAVDQVPLDEIPYPHGGFEVTGFPGELKGINETDYSLGLRPALLSAIDDLPVPAFVAEAAVRFQRFLMDSVCDLKAEFMGVAA